MDRVELERRLQVARGLVREVGQQALSFYRGRAALGIERKGLQDFVSRADRECEDLIVGGLRDAFPKTGFWVRNAAGKIRRVKSSGSSIRSTVRQISCAAFPSGACRWV
jgi:fructose-1,6-bisphosphatase/inositol monophosphatase family enzyme